MLVWENPNRAAVLEILTPAGCWKTFKDFNLHFLIHDLNNFQLFRMLLMLIFKQWSCRLKFSYHRLVSVHCSHWSQAQVCCGYFLQVEFAGKTSLFSTNVYTGNDSLFLHRLWFVSESGSGRFGQKQGRQAHQD